MIGVKNDNSSDDSAYAVYISIMCGSKCWPVCCGLWLFTQLPTNTNA